ncbi:hypothetical protein NKH82_27795 [Mesorhizobium sp. M0915]|uniref:hypothetical protein n=1 Tax=unclassified Mesorhizobium TaxID=325217 RepID=UPI0018DBCFCE|nr:hypothetical protein [Mesorhizobium sp. LSHC420B00]
MATVEKVSEVLPECGLGQPLRIAEAERLRKAWAEGLESGPSAPFDIEDIKKKPAAGSATPSKTSGMADIRIVDGKLSRALLTGRTMRRDCPRRAWRTRCFGLILKP